MSKKTIIITMVICLVGIGVLLISKPRLKKEAELFNTIINDDASTMAISDIMKQDNDEKYYNLFIRISEKSDYGEKFNDCSVVEQNYWILYNFHEEIGCGGIEQFIYNYYTNYEFALEIFQDLGLASSAEYLQMAINIYPNKRIEAYSDATVSSQLEKLDQQYYDKCDQEYINFIYNYVEENKTEFI